MTFGRAIWFGWIGFSFLSSQTQVEGMDGNIEKGLFDHLMRGYDKALRPSKKPSDIVKIIFGVSLTQLISLDEKKQVLTTNCWLSHNWIDNKLVWNPTEYSNITSLIIPMHNIWRPDILLYNNADLDYYHKVMSTNAILQYTGNVTWLTAAILKSTCEIDIRYFPFDVQNCFLKFASWTYSGHEVDLILITEDGDLSNFIPSCEWDLRTLRAKKKVSFYSCCSEPYPDITISISIRRRPLFYVCNYLVPCGGAAFLAFMGFFTPGESGEKVKLGIATLLSLTFFLISIGEVMPPTATVPLIELYYGATMLFVACATATQVWTLNIYYRGTRGQQVPNWIKRTFLCSRTRNPVCEQGDTVRPDLLTAELDSELVRTGRYAQEIHDSDIPSAAEKWIQRINMLLTTVMSEIHKQEKRSQKREVIQEAILEWRQLAHTMDRWFLTLFVIMTVCITILMFLGVSEISLT